MVVHSLQPNTEAQLPQPAGRRRCVPCDFSECFKPFCKCFKALFILGSAALFAVPVCGLWSGALLLAVAVASVRAARTLDVCAGFWHVGIAVLLSSLVIKLVFLPRMQTGFILLKQLFHRTGNTNNLPIVIVFFS